MANAFRLAGCPRSTLLQDSTLGNTILSSVIFRGSQSRNLKLFAGGASDDIYSTHDGQQAEGREAVATQVRRLVLGVKNAGNNNKTALLAATKFAKVNDQQ